MRYLLYAALAAAGFWIISELLEIVTGGYSPLIYWLTAAFHFLIAIGIWGVHAGQSNDKNRLSLTAAAITSAGYFIMVYPPIAVSRSAGMTVAQFADANPVFAIAGLCAILGNMLFGIAVLRRKLYPVWTGVALVICPPILAVVLRNDGSMIVANVANIVQSGAWIAMSLHALRRAQRSPSPVTQ